MRGSAWAGLIVLFSSVLFGQNSEAPLQFEVADVHASTKTPTQFVRTAPVRNGRYEIRTATMLDLIRLAWAFDADKILGGPPWLELDRFDVIAKVPGDSKPDAHRLMLQSLLKDRFQLAPARGDRAITHLGANFREKTATEGGRWVGRDRL